MSFTLRKATTDDIDTLVDIYFTTFKSPIVLRVKPNTPSTRAWFKQSLEADMRKPHVHVYVVESESETRQDGDKETIAFGKWLAPHEPEPDDGAQRELPKDGDVEMLRDLYERVKATQKRLIDESEVWYLSILATLPNHQRKGVASTMMSEFCRQVDATGRPAYLEGSPTGKPMYERFGFATVEEIVTVIEGEPYTNACMIRPARVGAGEGVL